MTSTNPAGGVSAWTSTPIDSFTLSDVSCASSSLCVAVDSFGNAFIGRGTGPLVKRLQQRLRHTNLHGRGRP